MTASTAKADIYADRIRLQLGSRRFLTEAQEKTLLLETFDFGLSAEDARRILASVVAGRHAMLASEMERVMRLTVETFVGARGWISPRTFRHATALYQRLSGGAIGESEARMRLKRLTMQHRWGIRGDAIFGKPK